MAAISGVGGKVTQGGATVLNITDWSLDLGSETEDTTSFLATGGWTTSASTVKKWSVKCSGNFDSADTGGQVALNAGLGNVFTVACFADGTHNWSGTALLTAIAPKSSATKLVTIEYSFQGSGACTYA